MSHPKDRWAGWLLVAVGLALALLAVQECAGCAVGVSLGVSLAGDDEDALKALPEPPAELPEPPAPVRSSGCAPLPADGPEQQACALVESSSHAVLCAGEGGLELNAPRGAFQSAPPILGVWCWCRPGECAGVLDCEANDECDWLSGSSVCLSGQCVRS